MDDEIEFTDEELAEDNVYAEQRAVAYPPIKEQLDAIWKGGDSQEEMRQKIVAIKDAYPKQEEEK